MTFKVEASLAIKLLCGKLTFLKVMNFNENLIILQRVMDPMEPMEPGAWMVLLELLVPMEPMELMVPLEPMELMVPMVPLEPMELMAPMVPMELEPMVELMAPMEPMELMAPMVHMDFSLSINKMSNYFHEN